MYKPAYAVLVPIAFLATMAHASLRICADSPKPSMCVYTQWGPRGFRDLGRMANYFQGAGEHW